MKNLKVVLFYLVGAGFMLAGCNSGGTVMSPHTSPYQIVVDAGSSGSRVYVYHKQNTESQIVVTDEFESNNNIALASFTSDPSLAGPQAIQPLLESACAYLLSVESNLKLNQVPTSVLGTAGMRLISDNQQAAIYHSVAQTIKQLGLQLQQANTISGQYEGLYSWLDVNYLAGNFVANQGTKGIIEVGGASAQVAFATSDSRQSGVVTVRINNHDYHVFAVSFLGLGQDQARDAMVELDAPDACYPKDYSYGDIVGDFNYATCKTNYDTLMAPFTELTSINQVADFQQTQFLGLSSVYYVLNFWNITHEPALLSDNITDTCNLSFNAIVAQHPGAYKPENQCANATYMNEFLFSKLKVEPTQVQAILNMADTTLSWTLGYALLN